jgi:hypothetical protein
MSRLTSTPFSLKLLTAMLAVLMPALSQAEAPRWYDVEVALIGYQDGQKINHENWPEILTNSAKTNVTEDEINNIIPEKAEPWSWIAWWNNQNKPIHNLYNVQENLSAKPNSAPMLKIPFTEQGIAFEDKVERFERTKGLQLIWSKKWQQPIPEKSEATDIENTVKINFRTPLNVQQALKSSSPLIEAEVSGEIYLYRSRYLHLVSKLNIQHWQHLDNTGSLDKSIALLPNHPQQNSNIIPSNSSTPLTAINEIPIRAAMVNQSRRMRSNELHYIDHPMLGILVKVTPLAE